MSRRRQTKPRNEPKELSGFKPRKLSARSLNQKNYIKQIHSHDITLCDGPAGSGKTHIAVGTAIELKRAGQIEKIVVSRPVVGVGQDIGYLPGTLEEKVGPYLVPIFDELSYYCEQSLLKKWLADKVLEIVPLSMMRGRTFNDCFVILDEAQNATTQELRMLLTRIGQGSKMVLAGDLTQSDLSRYDQGAFSNVIERLNGMDGIATASLEAEDIVRHRLIAEIEARLNQQDDGDQDN